MQPFYYVMESKETLKAGQLLIFSALSYMVFPVDILAAKRLPIIGWFDEMTSISIVYQCICKHITSEMKEKVAVISISCSKKNILYKPQNRLQNTSNTCNR